MSTHHHSGSSVVAVTLATLLLTVVACTPSESSLVGQIFPGLVPPPSITSITPDAGPIAGGTSVTIRGADFPKTIGVLFGDLAATDVQRINEGLLIAVTPAQAVGEVPIVLVDSDGATYATDAVFTYEDPTEDPAYVAPVVYPTIQSVLPSSGSVVGGTVVTIAGTHFTADLTVSFGGAPASFDLVDETLLTAVAPAHTAGTVDVTLSHGTTTVAALADAFTYVDVLTFTSCNPANGSTAGGTRVTIRGTGFAAGSSVLFGELSALQVEFVNSTLVTALAPPHAAGVVDLTITTPDLRSVTATGAFEYAVDDDGDGIADVDTDGDGLSDQREVAGWTVWVDLFGTGLDESVGQYTVTSDPNSADTDGDGLNDYTEFLLQTDPRKADTDNDGLTDADEAQRWRSSPTSVDTDGDCRGPDGDLPPNVALFDGRELYTTAELAKPTAQRTLRDDATSPTLADTDGDGATDQEEHGPSTRDALLADLPQVDIQLEDAVDVRLDVEYAEEQGVSHEYSESLSQSDTHESSFSYSLMAGIEAGVTIGLEGEASVGLFEWGKMKNSWEFSVALKSESTWSWDWADSHTEERAYSQMTSDSQTLTESVASGSMTAGVRITNPGDLSYTLDNLAITVRYYERTVNPDTGELVGTFKTMATLTPALEGGVTLAPGEATPVLQVSAEGINADRIKQFLAHPSSLTLESPYVDLLSEDGVDFDFVQEVTRTRTANLIIDFGDGTVERYCVATNVDRLADGSYAGLNLKSLMTQFLSIPVETTTTGLTGNTIPSALLRVRGLPVAPPDARNGWLVMGSSAGFDDPTVPFEDLTLYAGDTAMLVLITDSDDDGLNEDEEELNGTGDGDDSDADGISDLDEAKAYTADDDTLRQPGWMVRVQRQDAYRAFSDPAHADADGDGLTDLEERGGCAVADLLDRAIVDEADCIAASGVWHPYAGFGCVCEDGASATCSANDDEATCIANGGTWTPFGTDPTLADTDGDGLRDDLDAAPLTPAPIFHVHPDAVVGGDGLTWTTAYRKLEDAVSDARVRNTNGDPGDDVAEIWVAAGDYGLSATLNPPSRLGIYGGFTGVETKRGQRNPDPATNDVAVYCPQGALRPAFGLSSVDHVTLDGLTLSGFRDTSGGCMELFAAQDTTLRNLRVINCSSIVDGGAVYAMSDSPSVDMRLTVEDCVFAGNEAARTAGVLYLSHVDLTLDRCVFINNIAHERGGAIYASTGVFTATDCRFEANQVDDLTFQVDVIGGAISLGSCEANITNCRFAENSAIGVNAMGGGLAAQASVSGPGVSITGCVFWRNWTVASLSGLGGAAAFTDVSAALTNCTIVGNVTSGGTGHSGAVGWGAFIRVHNCVFACNGMDVTDDTTWGANLTHIPFDAEQFDDYEVSNSCFYPAASDDPDLLLLHSPATILFDVDPSFASGWETSGLCAPGGNSPLIDSGVTWIDVDPFTVGTQWPPEFDVLGKVRVQDGDGDGAAVIDIGAFEFETTSGGL